jgi:hypothetical protein
VRVILLSNRVHALTVLIVVALVERAHVCREHVGCTKESRNEMYTTEVPGVSYRNVQLATLLSSSLPMLHILAECYPMQTAVSKCGLAGSIRSMNASP